MSTTSAEEALKRAKEIAAKLSGKPIVDDAGVGGGDAGNVPTSSPNGVGGESSHQGTDGANTITTTGATTSHKRKRWGVMPDAIAGSTTTTTTAETGVGAATTLAASSGSIVAAALAAAVVGGSGDGADPNKRAKVDTAEQPAKASKRLWIRPPDEGGKRKPPAHYVSYLTRLFPGVLKTVHEGLAQPIEKGPEDEHKDKEGNAAGGDTKEEEEDVDSKNRVSSQLVTIQLDGKGASSKPPIPGMPMQPLHIAIEGKKEAVHLATHQLETMLLDAHEAPLDHDMDYEYDSEDKASGGTGSVTDSSMALVSLSQYSKPMGMANTSSYRPASVAQLIGQASLPVVDPSGNGGAVIEEIMGVPHGVIGYIIGRGGETIASLQIKTGCKVQIQKETDLQPGQEQRQLTLSSTSQEAIDECRRQIENMVRDRVRSLGGDRNGGNNRSNRQNDASGSGSSPNHGAGGGGMGSKDNKIQEAIAAGHVHITVEVPEEDVGLVIGKQGSTIRMIQDKTGASLQVPPADPLASPMNGEKKMRIVHITHPTHEGAQIAKQEVDNVMKSKPAYRNIQAQSNAPQVVIQLSIPDKDVGLCIGKGGCVIRHMQNSTNTRIQIPSQPIPGQMYRVATITGPQDGCNLVQQMINQIVMEQSSHGVMAGAPGGPQQQHQQQTSYYGAGQQQGNQQAYSAEWAAYHAAQAAAQQQQQQHVTAQQAPPAAAVTAASPTAAPAAAGQQQGQPTSSDAYYEQFFRYAYYYGEEAARAYYGAWSPPVGTPNPYGVNPAGVQPAPAPVAAAAAAAAVAAGAAAAPAQQQHATVVPLAAATTSAPVASTDHARETGRRKVSNLPAWMTKG